MTEPRSLPFLYRVRKWLPILLIGGTLIAAIGTVAFLFNKLPPSLLAVAVGGIVAFVSGLALQMLRHRQEKNTLLIQEEAQMQRDRLIIEETAQHEALSAYLGAINTLILDHGLREKTRDSDVRRLAQAWTKMLLPRLQEEGKGLLLKLLYDLNLISRANPVIELNNAALVETNLREGSLTGDLSNADLSGADLRGADLREADLSDTSLAGANLLPYNLINPAALSSPELATVSTGADLSDLDPDLSGYAYRLNTTRLENASLRGTDLRGAYLFGADLTGADLTGANLKDVVGLTEEQLAQAHSLEDATMPNGQKYEDWLKDREGRKEDGENE